MTVADLLISSFGYVELTEFRNLPHDYIATANHGVL